jgi:hypothetical protein
MSGMGGSPFQSFFFFCEKKGRNEVDRAGTLAWVILGPWDPYVFNIGIEVVLMFQCTVPETWQNI